MTSFCAWRPGSSGWRFRGTSKDGANVSLSRRTPARCASVPAPVRGCHPVTATPACVSLPGGLEASGLWEGAGLRLSSAGAEDTTHFWGDTQAASQERVLVGHGDGAPLSPVRCRDATLSSLRCWVPGSHQGTRCGHGGLTFPWGLSPVHPRRPCLGWGGASPARAPGGPGTGDPTTSVLLPTAVQYSWRPEVLVHHVQPVEEQDSLSDQRPEWRGGGEPLRNGQGNPRSGARGSCRPRGSGQSQPWGGDGGLPRAPSRALRSRVARDAHTFHPARAGMEEGSDLKAVGVTPGRGLGLESFGGGDP